MKPRSSNPSKQALYLREWREKNVAKQALYSAKYRQEAGLDNEQSRRWYEGHREQKIAQTKVYLVSHSEVRKAARARRRSNLVDAGGFTRIDLEVLYYSQLARCVYCQREIASYYHIDHIVPISRGGSIKIRDRRRARNLQPQEARERADDSLHRLVRSL